MSPEDELRHLRALRAAASELDFEAMNLPNGDYVIPRAVYMRFFRALRAPGHDEREALRERIRSWSCMECGRMVGDGDEAECAANACPKHGASRGGR